MNVNNKVSLTDVKRAAIDAIISLIRFVGSFSSFMGHFVCAPFLNPKDKFSHDKAQVFPYQANTLSQKNCMMVFNGF